MENAKIKAIGEYVILESLPEKSVLVGAGDEALKVVSVGDGVNIGFTLSPGDRVLVRQGNIETLRHEGKFYWFVGAAEIICRIVPEDEGRLVPQNA